VNVIDLAGRALTTDPEPGCAYDGMPDHAYHASAGISKHGLDAIARSPLDYVMGKLHPRSSTPAMALGTALHTLLLEPERFADQFVPAEYTSFRSKEAKAWKAEVEAAGKTVLATEPGDDPFWNAPARV